jgi:hypothetical protein
MMHLESCGRNKDDIYAPSSVDWGMKGSLAKFVWFCMDPPFSNGRDLAKTAFAWKLSAIRLLLAFPTVAD